MEKVNPNDKFSVTAAIAVTGADGSFLGTFKPEEAAGPKLFGPL